MSTVSPTADKRFMELVKLLEDCESRFGNCDKCPLLKECRQAFDSLAMRTTHYQITENDLNKFEARYRLLSKQLALC
jgi:hypothetical protein